MESQEVIANEKTLNKTKVVAWTLMSTFWVMATYSFILQETMPALFTKVTTIFMLLADVVIIILGTWLMRNKYDIMFLVSFIIITIASTRINGNSMIMWANGLRHYIPFLFILPIVRYLTTTKPRTKYFIEIFDKSLKIFLWLQVPCMVYQCILYGAYDNVGGSLGWMMSPVVSTLIYMISFYFIIKRWDFDKNILGNLKNSWIYIFLLFPSYLNETKISFIYLALFFLLLIPMYKRFMRMIVVMVPLVVGALVSVGYLYLSIVDTHGQDVFSKDYIEYYLYGDEEAQEFILEYLIEDEKDADDQGDIARGIKFLAVPSMMENGNSWIMGHGIGQFKGGTQLKKSKFAMDYDVVLKGTVMAAYQWIIELGIVGCVWMVCYLLFLFRIFEKRRKKELRIQWYYAIITILLLPYSNTFLILPFSIIYVVLVYLSSRWLIVPGVNIQNRNDDIDELHKANVAKDAAEYIKGNKEI